MKKVVENVVEEVVETVVKKSAFMKVFKFIFGFKWLWFLVKRSGRKTLKAKDLTIIELMYGLWIRIKWLVLGVISGYLLYYFEMFVKLEEWIRTYIDGLG